MNRARFGLILVCLLPSTIAAQRGDALSIVGAVLGVELGGRDFGNAAGGIGHEVQVRFTASGSRSSVGVGVYTTTNPFQMVVAHGTFVELRVALETDSVGVIPYVTARHSNLRPNYGGFPGPGAALGGGAGAVVVVSRGLQLDGSATLAHVWMPASDYWLAGHGVALTLRVGAAVRVG